MKKRTRAQAVSLVLLLAFLPWQPAARAFAQGQPPIKLAVGDWIGGAQAWGTSTFTDPTIGRWTYDAFINSTYKFTVTQDAVSGSFDLYSDKLVLQGNIPQAGKTTVNMNLVKGSGGSITGDRRDLNFLASTRITGTIHSDQFGTQNIPPTSPDATTINTTIEYVSCDTAIGNWDISVNMHLQNMGFTPTWKGYWAASRVMDAEEKNAKQNLFSDLNDLFKDSVDFEASLGTGESYDPTHFDPGKLMDLAKRATEINNKIFNLSYCETQTIGSDQIERWSTALAWVMSRLIISADQFTQNSNQFPPYKDLFALIEAAHATDAFGPGSLLNQTDSSRTEQALVDLTSRTAEDYLAESRGEYSTCQEFACEQDSYLKATGAVLSAVDNHWTLTVDGQQYTPSQAPKLLGNPPTKG